MGLRRVLQVLIIGLLIGVVAAAVGLAQNVASERANWGPLQFIKDYPWHVIGVGILVSAALYIIQDRLGGSNKGETKVQAQGGQTVDMRGATVQSATFIQQEAASAQASIATVAASTEAATGPTQHPPRVPVMLTICSQFLIDEPQWEAGAHRAVRELNPEVRCVRLDEENLEDAQKVGDASLVVLFCKASRFLADKNWLRRKLRFVRERHQTVKIVLVVAGRSDPPVMIDDCLSTLKAAGESVGLVLEETEETYINKFSDHAATAITASADQQFLRSLRPLSVLNPENLQ